YLWPYLVAEPTKAFNVWQIVEHADKDTLIWPQAFNGKVRTKIAEIDSIRHDVALIVTTEVAVDVRFGLADERDRLDARRQRAFQPANSGCLQFIQPFLIASTCRSVVEPFLAIDIDQIDNQRNVNKLGHRSKLHHARAKG